MGRLMPKRHAGGREMSKADAAAVEPETRRFSRMVEY
jgi:hypothetical protein